jgi:2-polyprenyl-6-hydroxyphenyl methylase/3-demethylubiquinone-9 3-methyltransferase
VAERVPGVPRGLHDPALFVNRARLVRLCARAGVPLALRGIRPSVPQLIRWLPRRTGRVELVPSASTAVLFQGRGIKEAG